jgi:hypothetical protein
MNGGPGEALALARHADAHGRALEALFGYECARERGETTVEDLLCLVALYVSLLDFGFAENARAPRSLRDVAYSRVGELLGMLDQSRGVGAEAQFWEMEARNAAVGELPDTEELRRQALVPGAGSLALLLALATAGQEELVLAHAFLEHMTEGTRRERYFRSLGSGLKGSIRHR